MVGDLVGSDGEKIRLQLAVLVIIGQAIEKTDECFLNDIFAGSAIVKSPHGKCENPAFISVNELFPGRGIALANLADPEAIGFRGH